MHRYLESICRHETEWHDVHPSSMLEVRLADSFPKIHEALDVKLAAACQMGGMAGLSLILAFVHSPELAAVCIVPFALAAGGGMWLGMNWVSSIDEITSRSYVKPCHARTYTMQSAAASDGGTGRSCWGAPSAGRCITCCI